MFDSVYEAVRPVGGTFGTAQLISDLGDDAYAPKIAIDGRRNASVVWSGYIGTSYRARSAFRPADGMFQQAQSLSGAGMDTEDPQIAIDRKGDTIVVWTRSDGTNDRVEATLRPKGGTFPAAATVSDAGWDAEAPQVAFDKRGNAIAVWTRDDGTNSRVQAAFRPVGGAFGMADTLTPLGDDGSTPQIAFDKKRDAIAVWSVYEGTASKVQAAIYTP